MATTGRPPRSSAYGLALALVLVAACKDNMFTGNLTPVPPVHRVPVDVGRAVILIDHDPVIETKDPNHVLRANEQLVPQGYRSAMESALGLAGFRVIRKATEPHDLVAHLAIAVTEQGEDIRQVYRCGLTGTDGAPVAQIDWTWPKGTFVETAEVFEFATHNVATEIATSPRVLGWLRSHSGSRGKPLELPGEGSP